MGQLALGSLWGYAKTLIISLFILLDFTQVIVFDYKDGQWQQMLVVLFRAYIIFWSILNTWMKVESYLVLRATKDEERKKLKLENELLEEQLKKLKDENP